MYGASAIDQSTTILFFAIFCVVPVLVFALLRVSGLSLGRFSIPSLFVIAYLVLDFAGIPLLFLGVDPERTLVGITDRMVVLKLLICCSASLLATMCGFVYATRVLGYSAEIVGHRPIEGANGAQRWFMAALMVTCVAVMFAYFQNLERVAFVEAWRGDSTTALVARSEMSNAFTGKYWRYHLFFRHLLDYCVVFFFADVVVGRPWTSGLLFLASFGAASTSALASTEKAPLIYLLVQVYLAYVILTGGQYLRRVTKYFAAACVAALMAIYVVVLGFSDFATALAAVSNRLLTGQVAPGYFYLELFPSRADYLLGESLPNPGGLLPFGGYHLTEFVANYMWPEHKALGIVGSAPTGFWAEAYANFGPTGIVACAFPVGVWLYAVSKGLSMFRPSPTVIAAIVGIAMHYRKLSETGLSNYTFDVVLCAICVATLLCVALGRAGSGSPAPSLLRAGARRANALGREVLP